MTKTEFMHGWALLTLQPWGREYNGKYDPDAAKLQFEVYYNALSFGSAEAWKDTALLYAAGSSWPSLTEIRRTLSESHRKQTKTLPEQTNDTDLDPEAVNKIEANLSRIMGKPFKLP